MRWLDRLAGDKPCTAKRLRELLATQARVETDDFMRALPRLDVRRRPRSRRWPRASRVGPYRLVARSAQGGMGTVWLAERADGAA